MTTDSTLANLSLLPEDLHAIEDRSGLWTRGDLRRYTEAAAAYFRRNNVGVGDRVAVVAAEDKRVVAALLGARAVGALTCPIEPVEAAGHVERIKPRLCVGTDTVEGADTIDIDALFAEPGPPLLVHVEGAWSAWGVNTSGSSGTPKTVILTEDSVGHITAAVQELVAYKQDDRIHGALPLHHTYGLSQLWLALASGACLYLPSGQPTRANLDRWLGGCTVLPTIATTLRFLHELGARPEVRLITLAGQGADADTRALFAERQPQTKFIYFYGLTEATTRVLWLGHDEFFRRPHATGRPIRGVRAWVEADGELWVEGPNVAWGYLDNPEETAYRFPGGRLRTGDYFQVEGDLFNYLGRLDGVFKRFGEKVIPERVEAALLSHPCVQQCLVTPESGLGGEAVPVAWVVGRDRFSDGPELIRHIRPRLPPVMVPVLVRFVSSLPLTPNGKIDRTRLPTPQEVIESDRVNSRSPVDQLERHLVMLWERVIGVQGVGTSDDFFELGGHSLLAAQLFDEIERVFGRRLPLDTLWYEGATVETLARLLRDDTRAIVWPILVPIKPSGTKPPLFVVHTIGGNLFHYDALAHALDPQQPVLGLQARGVYGREEPRNRIEDIAADCTRVMRERQPNGPYLIAGYSSAGIVAFETAQQLASAGQEVGLLALIDSILPRARRRRSPARGAAHTFRRLQPRLLQERAYHALLHRIGLAHWRRLQSIGESQRWAHWSYRARPYQGDACLFVANASLALVHEPALGWEGLILGGLRVRRLQGEHSSIVKAPLVSELAAALQVELDRASGAAN